MTSTTHRHESTAAALYVAFELSTKEWLLTMSTGPAATRARARVRPGDREARARGRAATKGRFGLSADAPVRSCYEAGRDGFWPHRLLTLLAVTNLVVDSSSIEVTRRVRQVKTDRLDGEKLLRMLLRYWGGERDLWHVVQVPTREAEDARHASRGLTRLQAERPRYRNRIHALLTLHDVRKLRLDARFPERLATTRDWADAPRLAQLRGVAARSATILAEELFSRDRRNRRQVGALTGLVSAPYDSGKTRIDQGLARSGLPAVRRIAVEIAWAWLRYQPLSALTRWYHQRFGHGGAVTRRIGIVALARRVIIALWRYVEQGIVPEGALLKA